MASTDKPLTVLLARHAFQDFGGGEFATFTLAATLQQLGHRPILLSNVPKLLRLGRSKRIITRSGLYLQSDWKIKAVAKYALLGPLVLLHYLLLILRWRPDVTHAQSRDDQIFFSLLKPIHRGRVVWTTHGDIVHILRNSDPVVLWAYKLAMRQADVIICLSKPEQEEVRKLAPEIIPHKLVVVPSGIDPKLYNLNDHSRDSTRLILGTITRIVESKGLQDLLTAWPRIIERETGAELWIVGDGNYLPELKSQAGRLKLANVHFFGFQSNVSPFLNAIDIFVYPTYFEGSPLAILEAMLFAKAIVTTNVGGIPGQLDQDSAILVEPGNQEALVAEILALLDDPKRRQQLGQNAQRTYYRFEIKNLVLEKIIPLYRDQS